MTDKERIAELEATLNQFLPKPHWSEASASLVQRLLGIYAIGPDADKGIAEFGFRAFPDMPSIQAEAAHRIAELETELAKARKDTERMDWLEGKQNFEAWLTKNPPILRSIAWEQDGDATVRDGDTLRDAIDLARPKERK